MTMKKKMPIAIAVVAAIVVLVVAFAALNNVILSWQ